MQSKHSTKSARPKVLVLGSSGLLGSAIRRRSEESWEELDVFWADRSHGDLRDKRQVVELFESASPDTVVNCAAVVGGIGRNTSEPETLLLENLQIDSNVIETARMFGVRKFLNFSSNCAYPVAAARPLHPNSLYQGPMESTNLGYAQAKVSAMLACELISAKTGFAFRTLVLSNLYGPGDNYSSDQSHLVGAIVSKVLAALETGKQQLEVWGTGAPLREFTYVDDIADFVILHIDKIDGFPNVMNLGSGEERTVAQLHELALSIVDHHLPLVFDYSRPDGIYSKLLDSSHAIRNFGWKPATSIEVGMGKLLSSYKSRLARRTL